MDAWNLYFTEWGKIELLYLIHENLGRWFSTHWRD